MPTVVKDTNFSFLASLLHEDLRETFVNYGEVLKKTLGEELVSEFLGIAETLGESRVSSDIVSSLLESDGFSGIKKNSVMAVYSLMQEDTDRLLVKKAHEELSKVLYRDYINNLTRTMGKDPRKFFEAIKESEFYIPSFNALDSETFKEVNLAHADLDKLEENMGTPILSRYEELNEISLTKTGYMSGQLIMVAGPPGSGKSLFMMSEAVNFAKQGKKVLYAAIGDLKEFDFITRMCAMILERPMTDIALDLKRNYARTLEVFPELENIQVEYMSPDVYTAGEWFGEIRRRKLMDKYEVFFIDYDTNFKSIRESTYSKGDEVYQMAYRVSQFPNTLVFIGSQVKISSWKEKSIGMEGAAESSRKQQIVDMMMTISKDGEVACASNHIGVVRVPKNRRGSNTYFHYMLSSTGIMRSIDKDVYEMIKTSPRPVLAIDQDLMELQKDGEITSCN